MGPYIRYSMKLYTYIRNFLFISCGLFNDVFSSTKSSASNCRMIIKNYFEIMWLGGFDIIWDSPQVFSWRSSRKRRRNTIGVAGAATDIESRAPTEWSVSLRYTAWAKSRFKQSAKLLDLSELRTSETHCRIWNYPSATGEPGRRSLCGC